LPDDRITGRSGNSSKTHRRGFFEAAFFLPERQQDRMLVAVLCFKDVIPSKAGIHLSWHTRIYYFGRFSHCDRRVSRSWQAYANGPWLAGRGDHLVFTG